MRNHIVSCGCYDKLVGIMKCPIGREGAQLGHFIKTKSHKPKVTNR